MDTLPDDTLKNIFNCFIDNIARLSVLRTCKRFVLLVDDVNLNEQYRVAEICGLCKRTLITQCSGMYAHASCRNMWELRHTFKFSTTLREWVPTNEENGCSLSVVAPTYCDPVVPDGKQTISHLLRRISPLVFRALEFQRIEEEIFDKHVFFWKHKTLIFRLDRYYRCKPLRIHLTGRTYIDVWKFAREAMVGQVMRSPHSPNAMTIHVVQMYVNKVAADIQRTCDILAEWHRQFRRRSFLQWFQELSELLCYGGNAQLAIDFICGNCYNEKDAILAQLATLQ